MKQVSMKFFALPVVAFFILVMASFSVATSYAANIKSGIGMLPVNVQSISAVEAAKMILSNDAVVVDLRDPYTHTLFNVSDDESANVGLTDLISQLIEGNYDGMPVVGIVDETGEGFVRQVLNTFSSMLGGAQLFLTQLNPQNVQDFEKAGLYVNTFENVGFEKLPRYANITKDIAQATDLASVQAALEAARTNPTEGNVARLDAALKEARLDEAIEFGTWNQLLNVVNGAPDLETALTDIQTVLFGGAAPTPPVTPTPAPVPGEGAITPAPVPVPGALTPPTGPTPVPAPEEEEIVPPAPTPAPIPAPEEEEIVPPAPTAPAPDLTGLQTQLDNITAMLQQIIASQQEVTPPVAPVEEGVEEAPVEEGVEEAPAVPEEELGYFTRLAQWANQRRSASYERRVNKVWFPAFRRRDDRLAKRFDRRIDRRERVAAFLDGAANGEKPRSLVRDYRQSRILDRVGRRQDAANRSGRIFDGIRGKLGRLKAFVATFGTELLIQKSSFHDAFVEALANKADGLEGFDFDFGNNELAIVPHLTRRDERRYRREIRREQRKENRKQRLLGQNIDSVGEAIRQIGYSDNKLQTVREILNNSEFGESTLSDRRDARKADRKVRREMVRKEAIKDRKNRGTSRRGLIDHLKTDTRIRMENRQIERKQNRADEQTRAEKREARRDKINLLNPLNFFQNGISSAVGIVRGIVSDRHLIRRFMGGNQAAETQSVEPQTVD